MEETTETPHKILLIWRVEHWRAGLANARPANNPGATFFILFLG